MKMNVDFGLRRNSQGRYMPGDKSGVEPGAEDGPGAEPGAEDRPGAKTGAKTALITRIEARNWAKY